VLPPSYYNFVRPHRALKFDSRPDTGHAGGIDDQTADVPEIFSSTMHFLALRNVTFVFFDSALLVDVDHSRLSMAA